MDISIGAKVICKNGPCGQSTYIILDPVKDEVTHFVVEESNLPNIQRLVSIDKIVESDHEEIHLNCTREELAQMEPFVETDFIHSDEVEFSVPFEYPYALPYFVWPFVTLPNDVVVVNREHLPPSELAVRRGAAVIATDGHVGEVDEFVVDPESGHITHLVVREGHFWKEKDVSIPVSEIDHIDENDVYLKIDRATIVSLPGLPIERRWH